MIYDFKTQLNKSESPEYEAGWAGFYEEFFVDGVAGTIKLANAMSAQLSGVDRIVVDNHGRSWKVEEKIDFYDNDRVALEYEHAYASGNTKPGWIEKPSAADFIAYRKEALKEVYIWSAPQARYTWQANKGKLIQLAKDRERGFVHGVCENPGYLTSNVCAPAKLWTAALAQGFKL